MSMQVELAGIARATRRVEVRRRRDELVRRAWTWLVLERVDGARPWAPRPTHRTAERDAAG
jgi:hypothetical protein